jgi:hypothetical protein
MIRIILIISLLLPRSAFSQPLEDGDKEILTVDGYDIEMLELFPKNKIRLKEPVLCMGEWDYTHTKGFILDSVAERDAEVARAKADRDSICETSKAGIRASHATVESKLRLDLQLKTEKLVFTSASLDSIKAAHRTDLIHHYVVEGVLSAALLGVISFLIIKN